MVSRQFVTEYYILSGNIQKETEKEPRKPFLSFEALRAFAINPHLRIWPSDKPQYKYKAYLVAILKNLGFGSIANVPAFILDVYKKQQMHATVCGRDAHKRKVTYILEKVNRNFFFPFFSVEVLAV